MLTFGFQSGWSLVGYIPDTQVCALHAANMQFNLEVNYSIYKPDLKPLPLSKTDIEQSLTGVYSME